MGFGAVGFSLKVVTAFVYVLKSERNGRYYVGSTDNLIRRYRQHASGQVYTTKRMLPIVVAGWKECDTLLAARRLERALKARKSRDYIELFLRSTSGR
jgi:putative endonuclease